jgi:hypothetical protein
MDTQLDSTKVAHLISREIASCVMELITLEHQERDYLAMLERKAELESRIAYLQGMEGRL